MGTQLQGRKRRALANKLLKLHLPNANHEGRITVGIADQNIRLLLSSAISIIKSYLNYRRQEAFHLNVSIEGIVFRHNGIEKINALILGLIENALRFANSA